MGKRKGETSPSDNQAANFTAAPTPVIPESEPTPAPAPAAAPPTPAPSPSPSVPPDQPVPPPVSVTSNIAQTQAMIKTGFLTWKGNHTLNSNH